MSNDCNKEESIISHCSATTGQDTGQEKIYKRFQVAKSNKVGIRSFVNLIITNPMGLSRGSGSQIKFHSEGTHIKTVGKT